MKMPRHLGALVALGALTALPACSSSMFGGHSGASSQYSQRTYTPPASYNTGSGSQTAMNQEEVPTSPGLVRKVQHELKQNGDYNSRIDGVWGPMTENGVRKWQQAHNLHVNGAIDVATLQSMNISTGGQNQDNANNSSQPYGNDNGQANNTPGSNNGPGNNGQGNSGQANNGMGSGPAQANANNGTGSANGQNNQANANGTSGNQNYNTAGSHQNGSSYATNPSNNMPSPDNSGTNNTNGNTNNAGTSH